MVSPVEKRAHLRQSIDLDASVSIAGQEVRPCKITDFCLGGGFLSLESQAPTPRRPPIEQGEVINVEFYADGAAGGHNHFRLRARVAGVFRGGIGVAFIEPDIQALLVLQDQASRTGAAAVTAPSPVQNTPNAQVLASCRQALLVFLTDATKALFKKADDDLFIAARDAGNDVEYNLNVDSMKEIKQIKDSIEKAFFETLLAAMEHPGKPAKREAPARTGDLAGLSLVDSQEFQDMLAIQRILEKAEPRYQDPLYEINARLSEVVGMTLAEQDNPVGPIMVCGAFHDAVQYLGASRNARRVIFDTFEHSIVNDLGNLYKELNGIFRNSGILPSIEKPRPTVPHRAQEPPPPTPEIPRIDEDASRETAQSEIGGPTGGARDIPSQGAPGNAPQGWAPPAGQSQPPPDAVSGGPPRAWSPPTGQPPSATGPRPPGSHGQQPPGATVPGYQSAPGGMPFQPGTPEQAAAFPPAPPTPADQVMDSAPPVHFQPAYRTARSLLGLNRMLARAPGAQAQTSSYGQEPAPEDTYATAEIFDTLNYLQKETAGAVDVSAKRAKLKSRVLQTLSARQTGDEGKLLGAPENDAIEFIANLVDSIIQDVLVTDGAKERIVRLEAPLLKVAMQDEGFLDNESHPARQVVNQLGGIDLPAVPEPGSSEEMLGKEVDQFIDHIVTHYDQDSAVFGEVLQGLKSLIERQAQAFDENLNLTVKSCENEQALLRGIRKDNRARDPGPARAMPREWAQWLERVNRLNVGDVIGIEKAGKLNRETLAWVDDARNKFIFVDAKGRKSSSMIAQELAMQLQRGAATMLSEAEMPALDRGIHSVFQDLQGQLTHKATHDQLTGLFNLKQFQERLEATLEDARNRHTEHMLLYLDLDHYKKINKTCGREAGDALLERFARMLEKQVGDRGYLCHLEGDAFGEVLEKCSQEEGRRIADKHRHSVEQSRVLWRGKSLPLSLSVGVIPITEASENVETLLKTVRDACMEARDAGGNLTQVVAKSAMPETKAVATGDSPDFVLRTLEEQRLQLFCQRIAPIDTTGRAKPHHEILVRIRDKHGELNNPEEFIHAAERSGRMPEVDHWIIRKALQWMANNKAKLRKVGGLTINLSGLSLSDPGLMDFVLEELTNSKVPPGKVLFEVTETAAIEKLSVAEEFIRLMRDYGCRFCLDDFGTGSSSYSYLKQLPVDYVKIDGMFVKDITTNENDMAVVNSINEIGHFMGKKTIAEYVHNDAVLEKIREIGVDYAQGFAIGKPAPLEELA